MSQNANPRVLSREGSANGAILTPEELRRLGASITAEEARRSGSRSFAAFTKQAWSYVPQCDPLVWNWHMDALAIHAEAVARAEINYLAVNVPPGHAKSVFWTVLWPAWIWTWWPSSSLPATRMTS